MTAKKILRPQMSSEKPITAKPVSPQKTLGSQNKLTPPTRAKATTARQKPKQVSATTLQKVGAIALIRHFKFKESVPFKFDPKKVDTEIFQRGAKAPSHIDFTLEPAEGDFVLYHPTPGFTSEEPPLAQLSIRATIYNKGTETVDLDKVVLEYKNQNTTVKKMCSCPPISWLSTPGWRPRGRTAANITKVAMCYSWNRPIHPR